MSYNIFIISYYNSNPSKLINQISSLFIKNNNLLSMKKLYKQKYNSIQECLLNHQIIPQQNFNNIEIHVVCDGTSEIKSPNFNHFFNFVTFNEFKKITNNSSLEEYYNRFKNQQILKTLKSYYENEYNNKNDISNIKEIYNELRNLCKKYNIKTFFEGSNYKTNLMVNRQYVLEKYKNNYIKFLDDDDLSCNLLQLQKCFEIAKKENSPIVQFNGYNYKHNICFDNTFNQKIITPLLENREINIYQQHCEDGIFHNNHKNEIKFIKINFCIYYYFDSSKQC